MKFSIIHASARPTEWEKSALAYYHNASLKHEIEYILVTEPTVEWPFTKIASSIGFPKGLAIYHGITPKSSVSHWNLGASKATGDIIILNSDDMFPPKDWDIKIADAFLDTGKYILDDPMVVRVGYKEEKQPGLMTLQVMTKSYHDMLGYALYPGYQSVYCDNDFTSCAEELGVVIEAPEIVWEHRHPLFTGKELDEVYKIENESSRYTYSRSLYEFRMSLGYKHILGLEPKRKPSPRKIVALCTPGKTFDSDFMFEFAQLETKCYLEGGVIHAPATSCNVYDSRKQCVEAVDSIPIKPDYYFWIDSDQLGMIEAYEQLRKTLDTYPKIDVVAGWTYMLGNKCINAGFFYKDEKGEFVINKDNTFKAENLKGGKDRFYGELLTDLGNIEEPFKVDWVGFGCVMMRASVVEKLAPQIFTPIFMYKGKPFWVADDTGFCLRCLDKGISIYLDPKAYVKHIKGQEVLPEKVMVAN